MDPNNLQNTINGLGGNGGGGHNNFPTGMPNNQGFAHNLMNQAGAAAGQYNPMILPQSYLNFSGFNMNYGNNQILDFQSQQQQQYLMQQHHNIQPMFQQNAQMLQFMQQHQPPIPQMQQAQVDQAARIFQQPEMQQQQPQQPAQVHQQQQPQAPHQRLFEEQCRQMEQERKAQLELQRQRELAEQAKLREQHEQRERERLEMIRKQEEEARLAEELRRKEEAERIEKEKLMKFAEEEKKKLAEEQKKRSGMEGRHSQIGQPLTLIATHFLPNLLSMIPFPYEGTASSTLPQVSDPSTHADLLNDTDDATVQAIVDVLSQVGVDDIVTRADKLFGEKETNDLFINQLPPLIRAVVDLEALDVDLHDNMELLDNENLMMQEDITRSGPSQVLIQQSVSYQQQQQQQHQQVSSTTGHSHQIDNDVTSNDNDNEATPMETGGTGPYSIEKRRQMMSCGKAPKASGGNQRKKKDMVEKLFDSLTDNFVPHGRRGGSGRRRNRGNSEDDEEEMLRQDLKLIEAMEAGEVLPSSVTGFPKRAYESDEDDEDHKFFDKKKKRRREERYDRPPTPTEVISARDAEWEERQKQKLEIRKKRHISDDSGAWNTDALAENDSFIRFNAVLDLIFEQVETLDFSQITGKKKRLSLNTSKDSSGHSEEEEEEEDEVNPELLIERTSMDELRREACKLKQWQKLHKVQVDRLVKIVSMLERNIRDVISADNMRLLVPYDEEMDEEEQAFKEAIEERLIKAIDAALTAMIIMTSHKMHKQVLLEDTIERAIALAKLYLTHIIYPSSDSLYKLAKSGKKKAAEEPKRKRRTAGQNNRSPALQLIYLRVTDLFGCFAELVRLDSIPDSAMHHMSSMSISSFFVANVGELQIQSMRLASNVFSRGDEQVRFSMINDVLSSLHRVPSVSVKNVNNGYRLGNDLWITNTTALVMQLIQSTIKMPKVKKVEEDETENGKRLVNQDAVVKDSFIQAAKITNAFLAGFLSKCSQRGNKLDGEEDYKNLFSHFLQELLMSLYQPEWPVAEMILTTLGSLLVKHFRSKSTDIAIRQASLDYLGLITARLRKDVKMAMDDSNDRLELVVKTMIFEEDDDDLYDTVDDVDVSSLSTTDRLKKLEQALIDYIIERKGDSDVSVEYAVLFYAGEWYKETAEDLDIARSEHKESLARSDLTDKERRKLEKKRDRMIDKGNTMKEFLMKLVDKKAMRKRSEQIRNRGNVMLESDALWAVKYLAKNREFSHSFEIYLKHIVFGAGSETVVNLRTRALKCLTMIIESDHEVLIMDEVQKAVHSRMMDSHAQVREASIELLGKFLLVKEDFIVQYYSMLVERILDSGIAVRKRVIRIMREICEKFPTYEKIPEMLSKMIRRVNDEEGVKKLVHETFSTLWFQPIDERISHHAVATKVMVMSRVVQHCIADATVEYLETLVHTILKANDKGVLFASKQIIDNLVDSILHLETKMANDSSQMDQQQTEELERAAKSKENQDRLLACLTTMAIFSKVRPELMVKHAETLQPYLTTTSTKVRTASEIAVMNEVVGMLERVVPLMSHPSDQFLLGIDDDLTKMATQFGMQIVVSSVSCAAAVYNRFRRAKPRLADRFLNFYNCLKKGKMNYEQDPQYRMEEKTMAVLQRALFTIGVLCRYFDFDEIIGAEQQQQSNESKDADDSDKPRRQIRDSVFAVLEFFSRSNNPSIKQKALTSLGHFCAQFSEYLTRPDLKKMYLDILSSRNPNALHLKIQILKNLEMFLQTEEKKLIKSHEDWETNKDRENLKEMELSGSGLGSTVIQLYWNAVLNSYFDPDVNIRVSAVQVTWLTLSQGLVTPGSSIATLIAMTTDPLDIIRNRIDNLLKEIDSKYGGMVQSKAILGVRVSYKLHQKIRMAAIQEHPEIGGIVRGVRFCDFSATSSGSTSNNRGPYVIPKMSNDGMALLSGLYQSLRTNRQQRRSFLQSILKLFADDSREKLKLDEWIFVADNVAMFPYQMMDEPLYVIRTIDQIVAQSGQSIIVQFKQNLLPLPAYEQQQYEDEDLMFDPENLFRRFPPNKDNLYELMVNSQSCFILLYIRNFLIKLYGFSDAKVQEYLPSEAAKVYEKTASRKNVHMFTPMTALEELNPQTVAERNTMKGDFDLAQKISRFRKMLLSLDRGEDNDDEDSKAFVPNQGDDYDDDDEYQGEEEETGSISSAAPNEE